MRASVEQIKKYCLIINFRFKRSDERMDVCFLKKKIKFSHTIVSSLTRNEMFYIAFVKDMLWESERAGERGPSLIFCIKLFHL